ncbi:hypothetical protein [Longitalea arenae]|uniref:hypothetical protein n=1 Tax=Longitalea arenae TaxID=2812558 RepID=UPI0019676070|nr:hypothetical protein [Longitalea arenae]
MFKMSKLYEHSCYKIMPGRSSIFIIVIALPLGILASLQVFQRETPVSFKSVRNSMGMQLRVVEENTQPTLRIVLPGRPASDRTLEIIFPEHLTIRPRGNTDANQIYMWRPGRYGERPQWRQSGRILEYERNFPGKVHMLARATLQEDGVRFHFRLHNQSKVTYDLIWAPIDPRLTADFHDIRLERTYVHHADGFDLLASETPDRLTIPLSQWLPARYLASYTWPIPSQKIERREGITYYNKSRAVDAPFIATLSQDGRWVIGSFTRNTGNVWSNPELTCQHVDPQASLAPGKEAILETKLLVVSASLDEVFKMAMNQRDSLK